MKKLLVLLQHQLTPEQLEELSGYEIIYLEDCAPQLFAQIANSPADFGRLEKLAEDLVEATGIQGCSIMLRPLGSPAFNSVLDRRLAFRDERLEEGEEHISSMFAHSERLSIDEPQPDGSVVKKSIFKHVKFIEI